MLVRGAWTFITPAPEGADDATPMGGMRAIRHTQRLTDLQIAATSELS